MVSSKQLFHTIRAELQSVYDTEEATAIGFLLMQHVFGFNKADVLTGKLLKDSSQAELTTLLDRLKQHEPVQYVLGETEFYGRRFLVNPFVLVPRPETEELVDWIIRENQHLAELRILDIGTGSGCIAISLAASLKRAHVTAIDVSPEALQTARKNAAINQVAVDFVPADVLATDWLNLFETIQFDVIVSNPPYVTPAEQPLMRPNVIQFEPHLALFVPDDDPLLFYRRIAEHCRSLLKTGGACYVEVNEQYVHPVADVFVAHGLLQVEVKKDLFGKERFVKGK